MFYDNINMELIQVIYYLVGETGNILRWGEGRGDGGRGRGGEKGRGAGAGSAGGLKCAA